MKGSSQVLIAISSLFNFPFTHSHPLYLHLQLRSGTRYGVGRGAGFTIAALWYDWGA